MARLSCSDHGILMHCTTECRWRLLCSSYCVLCISDQPSVTQVFHFFGRRAPFSDINSNEIIGRVTVLDHSNLVHLLAAVFNSSTLCHRTLHWPQKNLHANTYWNKKMCREALSPFCLSFFFISLMRQLATVVVSFLLLISLKVISRFRWTSTCTCSFYSLSLWHTIEKLNKYSFVVLSGD